MKAKKQKSKGVLNPRQALRINDMVYRLLLEVRQQHELEGDYNAIVGRLVKK